MRELEILAVGIRIIGILIIASLIRELPQTIIYYNTVSELSLLGDQSTFENLTSATGILMLTVAIWMVVLPISVAKLLIQKTRTESPLIEANLFNFMNACVTVLGIYILSWAIPDLVYNLLYLWHQKRIEFIEAAAIFETWISIAVTTVEIAIGMWCTIGAKGILKFVKTYGHNT